MIRRERRSFADAKMRETELVSFCEICGQKFTLDFASYNKVMFDRWYAELLKEKLAGKGSKVKASVPVAEIGASSHEKACWYGRVE